MVSRNPLVNHCAVGALMSRSTISVGSATLRIVSLRITTKVATSRRLINSTLPAGLPPSFRGDSAPTVTFSVTGFIPH